MNTNRRAFLKLASAAGAALAAGRAAAQPAVERPMPRVGPAAYKRIATEEAWGTAELFREWKKVLDAKPAEEIGFLALWRNLDPTGNTGFTRRLMDLGDTRLAAMDAAGIDMQILALTAPGVQVLDADTGTAIAADSNDQLAQVLPTRACMNGYWAPKGSKLAHALKFDAKRAEQFLPRVHSYKSACRHEPGDTSGVGCQLSLAFMPSEQ
jgi:hypothetical protein